MQGNSRLPVSAQNAAHVQLSRRLDRHLCALFRKPCADYNRAAFAASVERYQRFGEMAPGAPLILDAGCGVGESTLHLARKFPGHYVIGVDQSAARIERGLRQRARGWPANLDLVRADVVDYWHLLHENGFRLARHYLLYPNPWPKIGHLARRWHGHAIFPTLLDLGGVLECRSNWSIYVAEFALAVEYVTQRPALCEAYCPAAAISPFERKYLASGHRLFRSVVDLR